jgi:hypothetical protein
MLDHFNLPQLPGSDVQMFTRPCTVTNTQWLLWTKPRGLSMAHILCISGGGGGGGGFTAGVGVAGAGGGGGGGSGVSRVTIPLEFLPDRLYVQVGAGGQGVGSGGGTAGSGILSYVSTYFDTTATNIFVLSGAAGPTGGATGTGTTGGARGAGGTVAVIGSMPYAGLGIFSVIAGSVGAAGGDDLGAVGESVPIANNGTCCMGGSGGGGKTSGDFAGGGVSAAANSYFIINAPVAAPGTNLLNNGAGGPQLWKPFWSYGGMGGGATNAGGSVGGRGGDGAYGAGGGGGGSGVTGGRGGDGGTGLVIISCF